LSPSSHKSTATKTPSSPASSPSSPQSSPPSSAPVRPANDYEIVTTGKCYWSILYDAGANDLQAGVEFTISYNGASPSPRPFTITTSNPTDGYHSSGTVGMGTTVYHTGGLPYTLSPLAGQLVTVTATITSGDTYPINDTASIKVQMPTVQQVANSGFQTGHDYPTTCS